jgi:glycosyltransferase involved in cell wall biosynthesis
VLLRSPDGPISPQELRERFAGRVAILIPAFDEAANLAEMLPRMPEQVAGVPTAVLVIDDGSGDATATAALRAGAIVARLPANRGGGAALRAGYALMPAVAPRVVVTMDADGQHRPKDLERLLEPVLSGRVQLAQGSRVLGHSEGGVLSRELGIAVFNRLIRLLTGRRITDCSNSFRAIAPELLPKLELRQAQFHAAEFLIEAIASGAAIEEVPVSVQRRLHGSSKKPATLRYGRGFSVAILSAWWRSRRGGAVPSGRSVHDGDGFAARGVGEREELRL